jgi:hypothetical protein
MIYVSANEKAVSLNLHRYIMVQVAAQGSEIAAAMVGGCTSQIQFTHSSKTPGFLERVQ